MRLLIVTSDYPPALGGMAVYSESWARELVKLGADVSVVARRVGHRPEGKEPDVPARMVEWPSGPLRDPYHAYRHLVRLLDEIDPDLVMAHTWIGWGPALARLKGVRGTLFTVSAHGAEILGPARSPWYRFLMTQALKSADRVLPVSSFTAEAVAGLGISRERIEVIHNGVDLERYAPTPKNADLVRKWNLDGRDVIATVGGLVDRKGHDIVIRAMALLKDSHPNLRYLVAGGWALNSSREEFLRALVRELGLEDRVVFTGFVNEADLADVYRLGDLFVMPGREMKEKGWVEGFGISYLEAAACGVPIVATRTGGVAEAVTEENGVFVPEEDPEAVAAAVRELMGDPARRRAMSGAGLAWAKANSWTRRAEDAWGVLEEILRR